MRKGFENNVARRRPQLRRAAASAGVAPRAPGASGAAQPLALVSHRAALPAPPRPAADADGRRERLAKIKRAVAEIAAPAPRVELERIRRRFVRPAPSIGSAPAPAIPARAADSVLSVVEALGAELARAREREEALRDELSRAAGQARGANERLAAAYAEYLLQVAARRRTQLAQAAGPGRPAAAPAEASRARIGSPSYAVLARK